MNSTKEHILKTSLLLFLQKSYKEVTMKEIVEKTGLSKGAFYHYFDSKEVLFKKIVELFLSMGTPQYDTFSKESLQEFYHDYANTLDRSFRELEKMTEGKTEKGAPFNFVMIMFDAFNRFPEFRERELELFRSDLRVWKNAVSAARKRGEIHSGESDENVARLFLYCTDGVFLRFINNDGNKSYKNQIVAAFNTIYSGLRA